jgi:ClpP class serine protease
VDLLVEGFFHAVVYSFLYCAGYRELALGRFALPGDQSPGRKTRQPDDRHDSPPGKLQRARDPVVRYINIEDSEAVLRAIRLTDKSTPLDFVLHTPGGLVLAASQIARAVKRHPAKTTVFVPHYAMSGGTLIAMGASQIVMDENAVLGPIDPQLGDFPAASVLKVVETKPIARIHDLTLVLADQSRKAIAQVTALAQELLAGKMPPEKTTEVAHRMASGVWTHDFPITADIARDLIGLPVSTEIPEEVFKLTTLYPQAQEAHPSVFYLPGPRYKHEDPQGQEAALR